MRLFMAIVLREHYEVMLRKRFKTLREKVSFCKHRNSYSELFRVIQS